MSEDEIRSARFVVFCLEAYKTSMDLSGPEVADRFEKYGVVEYLSENYECLHSLGEQALVEDVIDFLKARGLVP